MEVSRSLVYRELMFKLAFCEPSSRGHVAGGLQSRAILAQIRVALAGMMVPECEETEQKTKTEKLGIGVPDQ